MGFCYSRNDYKSLLVSSYVTMCVPLHIPKSEVPKRLVKASGRFGTSLFGISDFSATLAIGSVLGRSWLSMSDNGVASAKLRRQATVAYASYLTRNLGSRSTLIGLTSRP